LSTGKEKYFYPLPYAIKSGEIGRGSKIFSVLKIKKQPVLLLKKTVAMVLLKYERKYYLVEVILMLLFPCAN